MKLFLWAGIVLFALAAFGNGSYLCGDYPRARKAVSPINDVVDLAFQLAMIGWFWSQL